MGLLKGTVLIGMLAALAFAISAQASCVGCQSEDGEFHYHATSGEVTNLTITNQLGITYTVRDFGATIVDDDQRCVVGSPHTAFCAVLLRPFCDNISIEGGGYADLQLRTCALVYGSGLGDTIVMRSGEPTIFAAGGADTVTGGTGSDTINTGVDRLGTTDGAVDRVSCGPGEDTVYAGAEDVVAADCEHRLAAAPF